MRKNLEGTSLVEILIYTFLLTTVLLVTYGLFAQASLARLSSIDNNAVYLNGKGALFDMEQTIRQATSIDSPAIGSTGSTLSLNSGNIIYQINANGALEKKEGTEVNRLTSDEVVVSNLVFQTKGPSLVSPTVKISFTVKGVHEIQGKVREENFQTAVSLR
jgi:hypothetical protein